MVHKNLNSSMIFIASQLILLLLANISNVSAGIFSSDSQMLIPSDQLMLDSFEETPDQKFAKCCRKAGLRASTAKHGCSFSSKALTAAEQMDINEHFSDFIGCYAGQKNNRACCANGDITGMFSVCLEFCDGVNPPEKASPGKYSICSITPEVMAAVSACNKEAVGGDPMRMLLQANLQMQLAARGQMFDPLDRCCPCDGSCGGSDCGLCDNCRCCDCEK